MRPDDFVALVATELLEPVDPSIAALAATVAARHPGARAVLFYGSCLRERVLDGLMLDFYLIVADYRAAYPSRWLAIANRLLPPNVFPIEADGLTAKYAVLSETDFARLCGPKTDNPSVWARFAQPSRLVWAADEAARDTIVAAVAQAAPTLLARVLPLRRAPALAGARARHAGDESAGHGVATGLPPAREHDIWMHAFRLTYGAELRAERKARPGGIVDADPGRYARFTAPALAIAESYAIARRESGAARRGWRRTQRLGKLLTLARLAKASATFAGGIDYLAWKINRHAGADVTIRPWQRRWPLIGALSLLPRLLARGAVR